MAASYRQPPDTDNAGGPLMQLVEQDASGDPVHARGVQIVPVSTPAVSSVAASASAVDPLVAANALRRGLLIHNDSASATLYIKFGATPTTSSYSVKLGPDQQWEMGQPIYTGLITGIWSAAVGNARITELTP